jgi:hypothetical protein
VTTRKLSTSVRDLLIFCDRFVSGESVRKIRVADGQCFIDSAV